MLTNYFWLNVKDLHPDERAPFTREEVEDGTIYESINCIGKFMQQCLKVHVNKCLVIVKVCIITYNLV